MKVIHKSGFSHAELISFKNILRGNALTSMQRILDFGESEGHHFSKSVTKHATDILEARDLTTQIAEYIESIWVDDEIQKYFHDYINVLQIPTTSSYFFDNVSRFAEDDYKPTQDDIIRCKLKTTGISETKFAVNDVEFTMVDVGGQRAERKKWLHCFDGVNCVIYLAALDEYNMTLQEDNVTNRLEESLKLFGEVTSSQWFEGKSFILFLNKSDIFKKKIIEYPLHEHFDDIGKEELPDFQSALQYMSKKYEAVYDGHGPGKLYVFDTNALDTDNCRKVFDSVRDNVISSSLRYAGFY
jgi:hypothetical protein